MFANLCGDREYYFLGTISTLSVNNEVQLMSLCGLWYSIPQSYLVLRMLISQRTAGGECFRKFFSGYPKEEKFFLNSISLL